MLQTARGAILIFLLLQITHSSPDLAGDTIGVTNPFTDYVKFLPKEVPLPTFYSEAERELLHGTSLEDALDQKIRSLQREFELLRTSTVEIAWCGKHWWDDETGHLSIDDWKQVDAMFRSRALDLPPTGHAMVPCVDMANHTSGEATIARYDTDQTGAAILQFRQDQIAAVEPGKEVTITYGDEKGASEMIFSYGFLEDNVPHARQLFLDLEIPMDDPLRLAKRTVCDEAPGVRIFVEKDGAAIGWESKFVWWICANEEDGLEFQVLQTNDGNRELKVQWNGRDLSPSILEETLSREPMSDIFSLRAAVVVQERIERQIVDLETSEDGFERGRRLSGVRQTTWGMIKRLRNLELDLLCRAYQSLQEEVCLIRVTWPATN